MAPPITQGGHKKQQFAKMLKYVEHE